MSCVSQAFSSVWAGFPLLGVGSVAFRCCISSSSSATENASLSEPSRLTSTGPRSSSSMPAICVCSLCVRANFYFFLSWSGSFFFSPKDQLVLFTPKLVCGRSFCWVHLSVATACRRFQLRRWVFFISFSVECSSGVFPIRGLAVIESHRVGVCTFLVLCPLFG